VRTDAKHQYASEGRKGAKGAKAFRLAPIRTCPTPANSTDLMGLEIQPATLKNDRKEAAALVDVLNALRTHPAVAWVDRMNSGAVRIDGRFVRFGWPSYQDALGQLMDDRLLGCEANVPTGQLRSEQVDFLDLMRAHGGMAFVARDLPDVLRQLAAANELGNRQLDRQCDKRREAV
jgi:hypothetical protein